MSFQPVKLHVQALGDFLVDEKVTFPESGDVDLIRVILILDDTDTGSTG